jgi:hypothetical protein
MFVPIFSAKGPESALLEVKETFLNPESFTDTCAVTSEPASRVIALAILLTCVATENEYSRCEAINPVSNSVFLFTPVDLTEMLEILFSDVPVTIKFPGTKLIE